jgi:hypothetical protein
MVPPGGEPHDLPGASKLLRQLADRQILDQHTEEPLVQVVRQFKFSATPTGVEPSFGNQEQHRLAATRRLVERAFPALASRDAALRVQIEENFVFPAVTHQPVA